MAGRGLDRPGFWLDDASISRRRCVHWIGAVPVLLGQLMRISRMEEADKKKSQENIRPSC